MKWVTREKARVDRIACPWLINRFIDPEPVFLFVPAGGVVKVAEREQAVPYDVPGAEPGHHGDRCSFDAFLDKYIRPRGEQDPHAPGPAPPDGLSGAGPALRRPARCRPSHP